MAGSEGSSQDRFRAFVSYAHADSDRAGRLQRRLEAYRVPEELGEILALEGAGTDAIGPIFRDREDLSAAADLSEAVRDALAASQALVVVCTPNTPRSRWVAREIELFRALHPDRPVLAALFDGEPTEAFPEALTAGGIEPLAADFRKSGDGDKLAFLKIVAGVLQVPLDRLIQRDAQRRLRRVTLVTAASLALVLIMAAMTVFAIQSRNEAQTQRAEAEGLIEYMLTDLRTELRGVGRLDVMEGVNERALDFYEGQGDLSELPDESLLNWSQILHAMGEDELTRVDGSRESALAIFRTAHATTAEVLRRDPDDVERVFGHAQSEYWVGRVHELNEEFTKAEPYYRAYANAGQWLAEKEPSNSAMLMEGGWGHLNLGIVEMKDRRAPRYGSENFLQAISFMERAAALSPDDLQITKEWGNAWAWLADSYLLSGQVKRSLAARERELEAKRKWLTAEPRNLEARYAVAKAKFAVAVLATRMGDAARGRRMLAQADSETHELCNAEPDNGVWQAMCRKIRDYETSKEITS